MNSKISLVAEMWEIADRLVLVKDDDLMKSIVNLLRGKFQKIPS
ncbi:hypothetical protein [Nostoc sp. TCL26-01]|nr:hypothetical protein [Nostoc sp. TCL26-01]